MVLFGHLLWVAFIVVGLAGFYHWPWWIPVAASAAGYAARELASGFQVTNLTQTLGLPFLLRSMAMGAVMFGVTWAAGYGVSFLF